MMEEIHGHEVIAFIKHANPPIKKAMLSAILKEKFGDATFYTCSQSNLSLEGLLEFLISAKKLVFVRDVATIDTGNVCKDGD